MDSSCSLKQECEGCVEMSSLFLFLSLVAAGGAASTVPSRAPVFPQREPQVQSGPTGLVRRCAAREKRALPGCPEEERIPHLKSRESFYVQESAGKGESCGTRARSPTPRIGRKRSPHQVGLVLDGKWGPRHYGQLAAIEAVRLGPSIGRWICSRM